MSSLLSGINELRSLITTPRDPLYQHLSDLIAALEEVSVPNPSLTVPKTVPSPRVEFSKCKRKVRHYFFTDSIRFVPFFSLFQEPTEKRLEIFATRN